MSYTLSAFQTVGPYFSIGLDPLYRHDLAPDSSLNERIRIEGRVTDGKGDPIPDAVLESWQADSKGRFHTEQNDCEFFCGFGRFTVDSRGYFQFTTIMPGQVAYDATRFQAPHIAINLQMRGLLNRLVTRIYFEGQAANESDPVLNMVPSDRRKTLLAHKDSSGHYQFNLVMQGLNETVFFEI